MKPFMSLIRHKTEQDLERPALHNLVSKLISSLSENGEIHEHKGRFHKAECLEPYPDAAYSIGCIQILGFGSVGCCFGFTDSCIPFLRELQSCAQSHHFYYRNTSTNWILRYQRQASQFKKYSLGRVLALVGSPF